MLYTNAVFHRKDTEVGAKECVVDKVIRLSGAEFDRFTHGLTRDWDFIRDNPIETVIDSEGRPHCLLIIGEERRDGILVNAEGGSYARYSAFIPNVESFLTAGQYPALMRLNSQLTETVDYIADQSGERVVFDMQDLDFKFGIDLSISGTLRGALINMLNERSEIKEFRLDKNKLTVDYNINDLEQVAENFSDPTVTRLDMNVYGYDFDGMVPLGKEKAFELYDAGYQIFRLYEDDSEGGIDKRKEIEEFDGLFGIEHVEPGIRHQEADFEVLLLNWNRYNKGEQAGEWLPLPANADKLCALLERIGVEGVNDSFTIANVRMPMHELLRDRISKHDSLDELNMLASMWDDMADFERDKLQAILTSGVHKIGYSAADIINTLYEENFDAFRMIDASDYESLGRYWEDETNDKPEEISFAEYGRQIAKGEGGKFTEHGYIYFRYKDLLPEYIGAVPDEYKIVGAALQALRSKQAERGGDEKPSVVEKIRAARSAPRLPKDKGSQKHKNSKEGQER